MIEAIRTENFMSSSAHALNHEIIDDLYAILGDGYTEIVNEQVQQALKYLQELQLYLQENDIQKAMRTAHALKSSAGQVGLQGIHDLTKKLEFQCIEDQASNASSAEAKQLYHTICAEFEGAMQALRNYISSK